jgi:hypothetical protein
LVVKLWSIKVVDVSQQIYSTRSVSGFISSRSLRIFYIPRHSNNSIVTIGVLGYFLYDRVVLIFESGGKEINDNPKGKLKRPNPM